MRPKLRLDAMVIPPSAAQSATASRGLPPGGVQLSPRRAGFAAPPAAAYASPRREPEPLGWAASPLTVMGHPVRRAQFQQVRAEPALPTSESTAVVAGANHGGQAFQNWAGYP